MVCQIIKEHEDYAFAELKEGGLDRFKDKVYTAIQEEGYIQGIIRSKDLSFHFKERLDYLMAQRGNHIRCAIADLGFERSKTKGYHTELHIPNEYAVSIKTEQRTVDNGVNTIGLCFTICRPINKALTKEQKVYHTNNYGTQLVIPDFMFLSEAQMARVISNAAMAVASGIPLIQNKIDLFNGPYSVGHVDNFSALMLFNQPLIYGERNAVLKVLSHSQVSPFHSKSIMRNTVFYSEQYSIREKDISPDTLFGGIRTTLNGYNTPNLNINSANITLEESYSFPDELRASIAMHNSESTKKGRVRF